MRYKKLSNQLNNNFLLITDNDLDGIVGGALFSLHHKPSKEINTKIPLDKVLMNLLDDGELYCYEYIVIIDKAFNTKETYELIMEAIGRDNVLIFDHHISNELFIDINEFDYDKNKCATKIVADEVKENRARILETIHQTNLYDLWKDGESGWLESYELNKVFNFLGKRFKNSLTKYWLMQTESILNDDTNSFKLFSEKEEEYIKAKVGETYIVDNEAFVFAEKNKSEIANAILNQYNTDIAVVIDIAKNSISVRSKRGKALKRAIEMTGGDCGGHENSAGGRLVGNVKMSIMTMLGRKTC